jgi:hypothetical protein
MTHKANIVINFDKSIRTATLSMANWNANHTINWDSVAADVFMDLKKYYSIMPKIEAIMESDFDAYAKETEDWMKNCSVTTFEKFEYLTVYHNL